MESILSSLTLQTTTPPTNLLALPIKKGSDQIGEDIGNYRVVIGNQDADNTLYTDWTSWAFFGKGIKNYPKRESLLIEAIRNFLRKENFAELNHSLNDEEITEEQYVKEIEENNGKYAITLRNIETTEDVLLITELINKIGYDLKEFTTSDVAEMFSVIEDQLVSNIIFFRDQQK